MKIKWLSVLVPALVLTVQGRADVIGTPLGLDPFSITIYETSNGLQTGTPSEQGTVLLPERVTPGPVGVNDPNGVLSDILVFGNNATTGTVTFFSEGALGSANVTPTFFITEDANGTAFYNAGPGSTCGVNSNCYTFVSGTDAVPEPSGILLLATVVLGLFGTIWKRRAQFN